MNLSGRCLCGQVTIELTEVRPRDCLSLLNVSEISWWVLLALAACSRDQITLYARILDSTV